MKVKEKTARSTSHPPTGHPSTHSRRAAGQRFGCTKVKQFAKDLHASVSRLYLCCHMYSRTRTMEYIPL